jgi:pimeloyl-ACP methyl ester carboxylesterase
MFVNNDGVKIHYESEGSGPAIIMHTGAGGDCRIWKDAGYVEGLPEFRKILMDQRGRGLSDRPTSLESHSYERRVSDICKVLDDAGVESAAFMGYSAGAVMGVAFGSAHPTRLRALVGIGTLPFANNSELPKPPDWSEWISQVVAVGGVRKEYEEFMKKENDRFPDPIHQNVIGGDPLMRALDGVGGYELNGPLNMYPNLRAPALIVAGELEDPERQTEKSIAMIPGGMLVRLRGIGHLSSFYRSDLTLPHIRPFLKDTLN